MFSFTSNSIYYRPCATCQAAMTLLHCKPTRVGFDLRTFVCATCGSVEAVTIETAPHR